MTMPTIPRILATTALFLAAVGVSSCQQTTENAPERTGCYLTYSRGANHISFSEKPPVYRLNADESRELEAIVAMGKADSVNLYFVPPEDYPIFLIYSGQGEPRTLPYYSRFKSHTDEFLPPAAAARFDALVQKIQSRPGAQLQGEAEQVFFCKISVIGAKHACESG